MALEKQIVPMPLAKGLDLSTADNLRDPDSLSSGINCEQLITGEIVKRQGFVSVGTPANQPITAFPLPGSLGVVEQSANMATNMQIVAYPQGLYSIYRTNSLVAPRPVNVTASVIDLIGSSVDIENYDMDWDLGTLYVAITLSGGTTVRSYRFDALLNLIPAQFGPYNELTGLTGASVKVVASRIFIYQTGVNTVRSYSYQLTYSGISYSLGGSLSWDVCAYSSGYVIGYDTGANITLTITTTATTTTFSNTNVTRVCVFLQGTVYAATGIIAMVARSTINQQLTAFRYNTSLVLQGTADTPLGSSTVYNITGIAPIGISNILFAAECGTATASDVEGRFVEYFYVSDTYTGTVGLISYGVRTKRAGLASKPLQFSTGLYPHILLSYEGTDTYGIQNSYFLMQFSQVASQAGFTAKIGSGKAPQFISRFTYGANVLPNFAAISATKGIAPILTRSDNATVTTVANSVFSLSSCVLNLDAYYQGAKPVKIGGYTVMANNQIYSVDAVGINEINFLLYPDPVVSVTNLGAGNVNVGTHSLVIVYESYDNKGNLIESAPSDPFSYSVAGVASSLTINLNDAGFISRTDVRVSLYSTVAAGTIYYLVGSTSSFTSSTLSISYNITDATLQTNKLLYTTGGVVENINPPNSNWIGAAKNRLWTFETGSTDTLWFSKESRDGFIPQFSDLLTLNVGRQYGALVGTAALDDKVLVFKEFCVMVIVGDGPSENLVGGWSSPAVIFQGMGCISARSITETPKGVFFQSQEGIYLVDNGMNVSFVGRPLYKSEGTLISSAYNPVNNCVYFLSPTKLWVYYITTGSWYEWTVTNPVDILYESGALYLITTTKIFKQIAGTWQDDASNYQQLIKLGQFQFAGIQGYQRVYKILATGRSLADEAGTVTVKNYFDANTTATDTQTIAQTALVSGNKMSLEIRPSKQKCETMQVEISHTANNSGITINAVTAEVGAIPGAGRRASTGRAV